MRTNFKSLSTRILVSLSTLVLLLTILAGLNKHYTQQIGSKVARVTQQLSPLRAQAHELNLILFKVNHQLAQLNSTPTLALLEQQQASTSHLLMDLQQQWFAVKQQALKWVDHATITSLAVDIDAPIEQFALVSERAIEARQQQLIEGLALEQLLVALSEQQEQLVRELDRAILAVDNEDDFSLMLELQGSLYRGFWIISLLAQSEEIESLDTFSVQLSRWAADHTSLLSILASVSRSQPELEPALKQLGSSTQHILQQTRRDEGIVAQRRRLLEQQQLQDHAIRQTTDLGNQLQQLLANYVDQLTDAENQLVAEVAATIKKSQAQNWSSAIIALLLALALSASLYVHLRSVIKRAKHMMSTLEQGVLNFRLKRHSQDEIGEITRAAESMAEAFESIVHDIQNATLEMDKTIAEVTITSAETSQFSRQQRDELDRIAQTVKGIAQRATEVAQSAEYSFQTVEQATQLASQGRGLIANNGDEINGILQQSKDALRSITILDAEVKGIEQILTTIRSIAEQTNLLALNAAIEAARAGEQGRGFAVVADEVRTLATRTQESTTEIQKMTESMQAHSQNAVDTISHNHQLVTKIQGQIKQTDDCIVKFADLMLQIQSINQTVLATTELQNANTQGLNNDLGKVAELGSRTKRSAQTGAQGIQTLSQLSIDLQAKTHRFSV